MTFKLVEYSLCKGKYYCKLFYRYRFNKASKYFVNFDVNNATESKPVKMEVSHTVILPPCTCKCVFSGGIMLELRRFLNMKLDMRRWLGIFEWLVLLWTGVVFLPMTWHDVTWRCHLLKPFNFSIYCEGFLNGIRHQKVIFLYHMIGPWAKGSQSCACFFLACANVNPALRNLSFGGQKMRKLQQDLPTGYLLAWLCDNIRDDDDDDDEDEKTFFKKMSKFFRALFLSALRTPFS